MPAQVSALRRLLGDPLALPAIALAAEVLVLATAAERASGSIGVREGRLMAWLTWPVAAAILIDRREHAALGRLICGFALVPAVSLAVASLHVAHPAGLPAATRSAGNLVIPVVLALLLAVPASWLAEVPGRRWAVRGSQARHTAQWLAVWLLLVVPAVAVLLSSGDLRQVDLLTDLSAVLTGFAPFLLVGLVLRPPGVPVAWLGLRVLLAAALAVLVIGIFVTTQSVLTAGTRPHAEVTALAVAALGALAALPVYAALRDAIARRHFGLVRHPDVAIADLGRSLRAEELGGDALRAAVESVAAALRSPAAELVPTEPVTRPGSASVPLHVGAEHLGWLVVEPRSAAERFGRRDLELLEALAVPVAQLAHAHALTRQLERARADAVAQRLDERRRLRRDLHDRLGPLLSGLSLRVNAMDRAAAPTDLKPVAEGLAECRAEVRRLVAGLEPAEVEQGDLGAALRELVSGWAEAAAGTGLSLELHMPEALPPLTESVRVTAYRVIGEAITNVVKHSGARQCVVRVSVEPEELVLEITDDGRGVSDDGSSGFGLRSLRERAQSLGGSVLLASEGGTALRARLPLVSTP